jgi:hypothetical protein
MNIQCRGGAFLADDSSFNARRANADKKYGIIFEVWVHNVYLVT